jgi:hypothetical protein
MDRLATTTAANRGSFKTFQVHFTKLAVFTKVKLIQLSEFLAMVGGV